MVEARTPMDVEKALLQRYMEKPAEVQALCESECVGAGWFAHQNHRLVWRAMDHLYATGRDIDKDGVLDAIYDLGIMQPGVEETVADIFAAERIPGSAEELVACMERACLIEQVQRQYGACADALQKGENPLSALDNLQQAIQRMYPAAPTAGIVAIEEALQGAVENITRMIERGGCPDGLPTLYTELDRKVLGLHPGELVVLAARPSVGKTALALNIASNVLQDDNAAVLFISLEMSAVSLVERMLGSLTGLTKTAVSKMGGKVPDKLFPDIKAARAWIGSRKLFIIDREASNVSGVCRTIRQFQRQHKELKLVIVDYLQLLRAGGRQAEGSREREVAECSAALKQLAKDLDVPVLVLSQLNRAVESRGGRQKGVPMLSDLRDSGSIEQDADLVLLLHRPGLYDFSASESQEENGPAYRDIAYLDIAKNRCGETGRVTLTYDAQRTLFLDGECYRRQDGTYAESERMLKKIMDRAAEKEPAAPQEEVAEPSPPDMEGAEEPDSGSGGLKDPELRQEGDGA